MTYGLLIIGVNHRTAPVTVRERLTFAKDEVVATLARLKQRCHCVTEAALLSTCNRVELLAVATEPSRAATELLDFLSTDRKIASSVFSNSVYRLEGHDAARHLFRVGASLDSMVVGEPQILGQLKLSYTQAAEAGTAGMVLHRAFHKAFSAAKRVRRATLIGHGTVSVSSSAVSLTKQIFDSLQDKTVLLIGAGKTAELTARQLVRLGVASLLVTNRALERAAKLAGELGGIAVPFGAHLGCLRTADVVIGSATTAKPLLGPNEFEGVLRERKYKPIFLIDLGVPRNFDDRLNSLENVYLYDIDDLGKIAVSSRNEREREAARAEAIIELELESFLRWFDRLELIPAIKDIRAGIDHFRELELRRHQGWLAGLEPEERTHVEALTRGIVNKIFHQVTTELRRHNGDVGGTYAAAVARRLLGAELTNGNLRTALEATDDEDEDKEL